MLLRKNKREKKSRNLCDAGEKLDHNNILCLHKGWGNLGDSENGIFLIFKLADRMRSMRMNGASTVVCKIV